jgi:hypothetical protein
MAEYTLTKVRSAGETDIYEVRLPDGAANRFVYTGETDERFAHWVAISVKRAQRESDYRAQHGMMGEVA